MNESPFTNSEYYDDMLESPVDAYEDQIHGKGKTTRRRHDKIGGVSRFDSSLGLLTRKFTSLLQVLFHIYI